MAITRTGSGTATDKTGSLTLTLAGVSAQPGDLLVVGLAYDVGQGAPQTKWGQRICKPVVTVSGNNVVTRIVSMIYDGATARTRSIVATWDTTAPTAKALVASTFSPGGVPFGIKDVTASQSQAGTAAPNSGTAVLINYADEVLYGVFGSEGPGSDTVGTVQNSWTSGQRAGTVGAPPVSNITAHEAYKIVTATESAQASKTGATARNFSTVMATFRPVDLSGKGVSQTDIDDNLEWFESQGLDTDQMMFVFNSELDRVEVHDVTTSTLKRYFDRSSGWVSV